MVNGELIAAHDMHKSQGIARCLVISNSRPASRPYRAIRGQCFLRRRASMWSSPANTPRMADETRKRWEISRIPWVRLPRQNLEAWSAPSADWVHAERIGSRRLRIGRMPIASAVRQPEVGTEFVVEANFQNATFPQHPRRPRLLGRFPEPIAEGAATRPSRVIWRRNLPAERIVLQALRPVR